MCICLVFVACVRDKGDILLWNAMEQKIKPIARPVVYEGSRPNYTVYIFETPQFVVKITVFENEAALELIKNSIFVENIFDMRRFFGLLAFLLFLNSCDDGNLVVEDFNFDKVEAASCGTQNNLVYKLNEKESFVIDFPDGTFVNEATDKDIPKILALGGANNVYYNFYDGTVTAANICDIIRPTSPNVSSRWVANSGSMAITTTPIIDDSDVINNSTKITGYNHYIEFKNITFTKSDGTPEKFETKVFGNYKSNITGLIVKANYEPLTRCTVTTPNLIYGIDGNNALTLNIDPSLFTNAVVGTPISGVIGASKNTLIYTLFKSDGTLKTDYFCTATPPTLPSKDQEWKAVDGVDGVSGIVEVTKTSFGTDFRYSIVLKKVTLSKGNSSFTLGDKFVYGYLQLAN
jgi:hypothetical protein